jgi:prepilin-type N-terminal cleavage/methylation domain-containing protein
MRQSSVSKTFRRSAGFSLVELMIVVGVIGLLVAIAAPKTRTYMLKARQAEATTNLKIVSTLQVAAFAENERYYNPPIYAYPALPLVKNDISTPTSCIQQNALGFAVTDCTKARFQYYTTGNDITYTAWATEMVTGGARRVAPDCNPSPPVGSGFSICAVDYVYGPPCFARKDANNSGLDYWEIVAAGALTHGTDVTKRCR